MIPGSCLCGEVRYEVSGPFSMMGHCHCSICRKHHGAMFATFVAVPGANFRWLAGEKSVRSYESSPGGSRSFCRVCGSVTPLQLPQLDIVFLPAGNLQGDLDARPENHIFVKSKAPWHEITDRLPQYDEYPPGFDAPQIQRPIIEPKEGVVQGSCLCGDVSYEMEGTAGARTELPLLALPSGPECRARNECVLSFGAVSLGARRGGRCGLSARRRTLFRYRVLPALWWRRGARLTRARDRGSSGRRPRFRSADASAETSFVDSKANWFEITDQIPQFAEMPPS